MAMLQSLTRNLANFIFIVILGAMTFGQLANLSAAKKNNYLEIWFTYPDNPLLGSPTLAQTAFLLPYLT
jgi:hypothetical protein